MDDPRKEERKEQQWEDRAPNATTRWLVILSVLLFAAAIFAGGYAYEQNEVVTDLNQQNQAMHATEAQMTSQINALTAKIEQMTMPPAAPASDGTPASSGAAPASNAEPGSVKSPAKRTASAGSSAQDRRMKQMQAQLAEQQKQWKETQDDLASARSDLEGKLGSTRNELNGSIARTHDELASLEKRGVRRYFEFDMSRSKSFQHVGPIQISLRKADPKHQNYDLMILVDDHQLAKKKVDLYEPIWLDQADQPQPVQIVINQIGKDHIHGYVSAPKYRESELASNAAQLSMDSNSKPISTSSSNSSSHSTSTTPSSTPATSSQGEQQPVE